MTDATSAAAFPAVERFLRGLETGQWDGMDRSLSAEVVYDASVPAWRSQYRGAERVLGQYMDEWSAHPWRIVEQHITPTADGVVIDLEARGRCPGDDDHGPHEEAVRMANIFRLRDGQIAEHRVYCCGEWDETTLRRIEETAPRIDKEIAR